MITWDRELLAWATRADWRRLAMAILAVVLVGSVVGLAGTAHADWGPPGLNGAKIYLTDDGYPPTSYDLIGGAHPSVKGDGFAPGAIAQIFLCPENANDLHAECLEVGAAPTDAAGNFGRTDIHMWGLFVSASAPTGVTCRGPAAATQCSVIAATFDLSSVQPNAKAEHFICWSPVADAACKPKPPADQEDHPLNSAHGERLVLSRDTELAANVGLVDVSGNSFVPNATAEIFQCPALAPDLHNECTRIGVAPTDSGGAFGPASVPMSGGAANCSTYGPSQCSVVAATFANPLDTDPTSRAEHYVCFGYSLYGVSGYQCVHGDPTRPTTTTTEPQWQGAAPMTVGRQAPASAVGPDGRIYAIGGIGVGGQVLSSAETLDPCGKRTWSPIAPMPTARTAFAAATGQDGRIYAIGGIGGTGVPLATVDVYDPVTDTWSGAASLAAPRRDLAVVTGADGRIYAIGGVSGDQILTGLGTVNGRDMSKGVEVSTVEAYDPATNTWQLLPPLNKERRNPGAMAGSDGRIYVIDGSSTGNASPLDVEYYTPGPAGAPGVWQTRPARRIFASAPAMTSGPDARLYALGGGDVLTGAFRSVTAYDPVKDLWESRSETLTSRRAAASAASGRDGRVYAIGGLASTDDPNGLAPLDTTETQQVAPNTCPRLTAPADFDGNGSTDVSVFRPDSGTWFVKDGQSLGWGAQGDVAIPGDFDGDRKVDVAIFRPATGLWAIHGSAGTDTFVTYGIGSDIPVPADYDGDGRTDLAIYRPEFATWWIHRSSDGTDVATTFGIPSDVPVPADYDGDGKADLGIFRAGTWFVHTALGVDTVTGYGAPGDVPVTGDYDGDHTADLAVFRPSDGTWYLHHSSDSTDEAFSFGAPGDVPQPGDYNGDGITDPALFRPATSQWFIETGETYQWGNGTDVPLPLPYAVRATYFPGA